MNTLTFLCLVGLLALVLFVILPALLSKRKRTNADYERLSKEMGYTPYTPKEKKLMKANERQSFNENAASTAFWAGSDTYVDYDGRTRNVGE